MTSGPGVPDKVSFPCVPVIVQPVPAAAGPSRKPVHKITVARPLAAMSIERIGGVGSAGATISAGSTSGGGASMPFRSM